MRLRYEADGELAAMHYCHCSRCRKHSGAAFEIVGSVQASQFRWVSGEGTVRAYRAPGWSAERLFCGTCGSSLGARDEHWPGFVFIAAGTLDDDPGARPLFHLWAGSKAPWFTITDELPQFSGGGEDESSA